MSSFGLCVSVSEMEVGSFCIGGSSGKDYTRDYLEHFNMGQCQTRGEHTKTQKPSHIGFSDVYSQRLNSSHRDVSVGWLYVCVCFSYSNIHKF